jgi:tyrosyl-tRNA synthetase
VSPRSADEQLSTVVDEAFQHLISEEELRSKLASGRPLRVKLGIDPTASDIHLGFAVVLRKLRRFQELGHTAVLILGDYTAQIGDPSGRSATRPRLSKAMVDEYAATYVEQLHRILLPEPLEIRRNSEWLAAMDIEDVLRLTSRTTVARMLERDDFSKRYAAGLPISVMELLYPLLQGWDSVMVHADVELGGTDQIFNFHVARQLQEQEGQEPQVILTMPLLVGLDGVNKMSKSLGNYVGITEPAGEQFGKLMSLPDELMSQYFELATGWPLRRAAETTRALERGALAPVDAKRMLARAVADLYHGEGAGELAEAEFDRVFKAHELPSDVAVVEIPDDAFVDGQVLLAKLLAVTGLAASTREGRRLIEQGGVKVDRSTVDDPGFTLSRVEAAGRLLQVGRRRWVRTGG